VCGVTSSDVTNEELVARWTRVVHAVSRTQDRLLARVEAAGVSDQWFGVLQLLLLAEGHRMPMTRLARDLSMTAGGFTKLADRMGREGLIDRRGSEGDRRVVYATLTERGLESARRGEQAYHLALRDIVLSTLSAAQVVEISESLGSLADTPLAPTEVAAVEPPDQPGETPAVRDPDQPDRRRRPGPRIVPG
jgi:DNA-binding MarR family transcriptional regulator